MPLQLVSTGLIRQDPFPTDGALAAPWTVDSGAWAVAGGVLSETAGGDAVARDATGAGVGEQVVQARLTRAGLTAFRPWVVARHTGASFYFAGLTDDGTTKQAALFLSGVPGALAQASFAYADGAAVRAKLAVADGSQRAWFEGGPAISAANAALNGQLGRGGLRSSSLAPGAASTFDDFVWTSSNKITIKGLPRNAVVRVPTQLPGGGASATQTSSTGADVVLDVAGAFFPIGWLEVVMSGGVIDVYSPAGGVFGGDVYQWVPHFTRTAQQLPYFADHFVTLDAARWAQDPAGSWVASSNLLFTFARPSDHRTTPRRLTCTAIGAVTAGVLGVTLQRSGWLQAPTWAFFRRTAGGEYRVGLTDGYDAGGAGEPGIYNEIQYLEVARFDAAGNKIATLLREQAPVQGSQGTGVVIEWGLDGGRFKVATQAGTDAYFTDDFAGLAGEVGLVADGDRSVPWLPEGWATARSFWCAPSRYITLEGLPDELLAYPGNNLPFPISGGSAQVTQNGEDARPYLATQHNRRVGLGIPETSTGTTAKPGETWTWNQPGVPNWLRPQPGEARDQQTRLKWTAAALEGRTVTYDVQRWDGAAWVAVLTGVTTVDQVVTSAAWAAQEGAKFRLRFNDPLSGKSSDWFEGGLLGSSGTSGGVRVTHPIRAAGVVAGHFGAQTPGPTITGWSDPFHADPKPVWVVERANGSFGGRKLVQKGGKVVAVDSGTEVAGCATLVPDALASEREQHAFVVVRTSAGNIADHQMGVALQVTAGASIEAFSGDSGSLYYAALGGGGLGLLNVASGDRRWSPPRYDRSLVLGRRMGNGTSIPVRSVPCAWDADEDWLVEALATYDPVADRTRVQLRAWRVGDAQPGWMIDVEEVGFFEVGRPALWSNAFQGYRRFDYASLAVGGSAAALPSGMVRSPEFVRPWEMEVQRDAQPISVLGGYSPTGAAVSYVGEWQRDVDEETETWFGLFAAQGSGDFRWPLAGVQEGKVRPRVKATEGGVDSPWAEGEWVEVLRLEPHALRRSRRGLIVHEEFIYANTPAASAPQLGPDWAFAYGADVGVRSGVATQVVNPPFSSQVNVAYYTGKPARRSFVAQFRARRDLWIGGSIGATGPIDPDVLRAGHIMKLGRETDFLQWASFVAQGTRSAEADTLEPGQYGDVKHVLGSAQQEAFNDHGGHDRQLFRQTFRRGLWDSRVQGQRTLYDGYEGYPGFNTRAVGDDVHTYVDRALYYRTNTIIVRRLPPGWSVRVGPDSPRILALDYTAVADTDGIAQIDLKDGMCPFGRLEVLDAGGGIQSRIAPADFIYGGEEWEFNRSLVQPPAAEVLPDKKAARLELVHSGLIWYDADTRAKPSGSPLPDYWRRLQTAGGTWDLDDGAVRLRRTGGGGTDRICLDPDVLKAAATLGATFVAQAELKVDDPTAALDDQFDGVEVLDHRTRIGLASPDDADYLRWHLYAYDAGDPTYYSAWWEQWFDGGNWYDYEEVLDGGGDPDNAHPIAWPVVAGQYEPLKMLVSPQRQGTWGRNHLDQVFENDYHVPTWGWLFGLAAFSTGTYTRWYRRLALYEGNNVYVGGLPLGYSVEIDGGDRIYEDRGLAAIPLYGLICPLSTITVYDRDGDPVTSLTPGRGVWGGDFYEMACCKSLAPRRCVRGEVWTDFQCAGGVREDYFRLLPGSTRTMELNGRERVVLRLPMSDKAAVKLKEQKAVRTFYADDQWEEWRIVGVTRVRDASGARVVEVEGESPKYALQQPRLMEKILPIAGPPGADGQPGAELGRIVLHDWEQNGLVAQDHLTEALKATYPWFMAGAALPKDPTRKYDMSVRGDNALSFLRELSKITTTELCCTPQGTTGYCVDLVQAIGSEHAKTFLRFGANLRVGKKRGSSEQQATRIYPFGGKLDGYPATMAGARWKILAVGDGYIDLDEQPIGWSHALIGTYIELLGTTLRLQVTDTDAGLQRVYLQGTDGLEAGQYVVFRRDAFGTELTYLEHPDYAKPVAEGGFGVVEFKLERDDIPPVDNYVPNAFLDDWSAGLQGWSPVGAAVVQEESDEQYVRLGTRSAHVTTGAADEGIETDWIDVVPKPNAPYFTAQSSFYIAQGKVRLEVDVDTVGDGSRTVTYPDPTNPDEEPAVSSTRMRWIDDLKVYGMDLFKVGARRVKLRFLAHEGSAEFYLDAAQLTETADGVDPFFNSMASKELWYAAIDYADIYAPPVTEYEVEVVDRYAVDPARFPLEALALGQLVAPFDDELGTYVDTRLVMVESELPSGMVTQLRLSNRPEDISGILGLPDRRAKRKPRGGGAGADAPSQPPPAPPTTNVGGSLSAVFLTRLSYSSDPAVQQMRVQWAHNDVVQANTGGAFTIDIVRYSPGSQATVVSGRDPRFEYGGTDGQSGFGSWQERAFACEDGNPRGVTQTWRYEVVLKENGTEVGRYPCLFIGSFLDGGLTKVRAELYDGSLAQDGSGPFQHNIYWDHDQVVEDGAPDGPWLAEVYESIDGGVFNFLPLSQARPANTDWQGANNVPYWGGFATGQKYPLNQGDPNAVARTYQYQVKLINFSGIIATYTTNLISGYYDSTQPA